MRRLALATCLLLTLGGWDWLKSPDADVEAGNEAFEGGAYSQALGLYERSEGTAGSNAAIRFDIGAALYKMAIAESDEDKRAQLLERAESAFREATDTDDHVLKSAAFHNLGNSMFVRERWKPAADAYKKALKANQENDDARYNLELVLRRQQKKEQNKTGQGQGGQTPKQPGQGQQQKPKGQNGNADDQSDPSGSNQGPSPQGPGQQAPDPGAGQGPDADKKPQAGDGNQKGDPSQGQPQSGQPPPGQGSPQPQPQPGQGQPTPRGPAGGQPPPGTGGEAEADLSPGEGETKTDRDRKLDALENRSRDLRRRRLRRGGASGGTGRFNQPKDW